MKKHYFKKSQSIWVFPIFLLLMTISLISQAQCPNPVITSAPSDVTVTEGSDATFTVVAEETGTLSYHWFIIPGGVGEPTEIAEATTNELVVTTTLDMNGNKFYCVVINTCGEGEPGAVAVPEIPALLTVNACIAPVITCPENIEVENNEGYCGAVVSFAATAPEIPTPAISYTIPGQAGFIASPYFFPIGTTTVVATATSCTTSTCQFTVTVLDTEVPVVAEADGSSTVECISEAVAPTAPEATDNCGTITGVLVSTTDTPSPLTCEGTREYKYSYTDASGNIANWIYTYTIDDTQAPTVLTQDIAVTLGMNGEVSITPSQINNASTDNCAGTLTYSLDYSTFNCDDLPGKQVTLTAEDCAANSADNTAYVTVNERKTDLTISAMGWVDYSDPITLKATLKDAATETALADREITFVIGNQSAIGTTDEFGVAEVTLVIKQQPGNYTIEASYDGKCPFAGTTATKDLEIKHEKACATYTGILFASTGSVNSNFATLLLSATLVDSNDGYRGQITNAVVDFLADGNLIASIPVGLVNPGDSTVGSAATEYKYDLGNAAGKTITIQTLVKGYYTNQLSADCVDATEVTVYRPTSEFITGGGYLILQPGKQAGSLQADDYSKTNFGFNVKYNKKGTNLQGNINIITRKTMSDFNPTLAEGAGANEDITHKIQIKGTVLSTLSVNTTKGTAVFTGKAVAQDITDPLNEVSISGNFVIKVVMTDKGEPGKDDLLSITVFDKNGGVFFSSRWENNQPVQQLLAGGNLKTSANSSLKSADVNMQISPVSTTEPMLNVYPNPFTSRLNIEFSSANDTHARLDIYSVTGARLETLWNAPVSAGVQYKVEYLPRLSGSQMVFYHLTMDGKTQIGKAIFNK